MALSNRERVGKGLDLLRKGLRPFVERELTARLGRDWADRLDRERGRPLNRETDGSVGWDNHALLSALDDHWNDVFKQVLSRAHRNLVIELKGVRNDWAHERPLDFDRTYRSLSSMRLLLEAISAAEPAREVQALEQDLLRTKFAEQARTETRRAATGFESQTQAGLRPWRAIVTPHRDVSSGTYQQAEFAADLDQVHRGEGSDEYRAPDEFFRRTFITEGLKQLLLGALARLTGTGGDPVVELQTNFGGGKTHSMLALYHLFGGGAAASFAGVDSLLKQAGIEKAPEGRRAVIVGTALSPGQAHVQKDGTRVATLWGELAWQLGGAKGYARVAEADAAGTSPGSQVLTELFREHEPCLVLVDEWVAYVRQLYGVSGASGGTFDANLSFVQSITEAARQCKRTLVVASLPQSDIEIGGDAGVESLKRLKQTFDRVETTWRPASADEAFEIVRRRLFEPITDPKLHAARDAVLKAFSDLYRTQPQEFPSGKGEGDYRRRLELAYPIHPELFDRLYEDWSTLDRFQRTRGVLRLMASVIHSLWEREDKNLLVLPSTIAIDDEAVRSEITRYLPDLWDGVIAKDVDGPTSLPLKLDRENPNLGRYSAARRVARTIFVGTVPGYNGPHPGIDPKTVNLGCVQPGEAVATFGDALRRLSDQATYMYVDGQRYWLSTQPSVTRVAQDRAEQQSQDDVHEEIVRRLRQDRTRGDFAGVHIAPESSADIPDEQETRLVVLGPNKAHVKKSVDSSARKEAAETLAKRGASPRLYQNALIFLAPEDRALAILEAAVRQYLAWSSIEHDHEALNLTAFAKKQAETKREDAERAIQIRIPEAWASILAPHRPDPTGEIEWQELSPRGEGTLAERVSKRLVHEEHLFPTIGAGRLRMELDRSLWRDHDHLSTKKLWEYLASYLYLPRLRDEKVLIEAIVDGLRHAGMGEEHFGYAEGFDEATGRYLGLRTSGSGPVSLDSASLLVKPDVARAQLAKEAEREPSGETTPGTISPAGTEVPAAIPTGPPPVRRFHGSVSLNPERIGRDAGRVAEEVVQHLVLLPGATVRVTLEIQAELPGGASEAQQRTVSENCNTLRFTVQGFETE